MNEGQFNGFFGLYLNASTTSDLFIGKAGGGTLDEFVLESRGGLLQRHSDATTTVGEEYVLVVRADFFAGNDRFTLYVDPSAGDVEPLEGTIKFDSDVGTVNGLTIYSTGAFSIDEIRIGYSFAEVVPVFLLGDYNENGVVDAADYTVWCDKLGSPDALPNDDTAGVGPDDYDRWITHFGEYYRQRRGYWFECSGT